MCLFSLHNFLNTEHRSQYTAINAQCIPTLYNAFMLKLIAHSVYGYCLAVKKIFTEKPTCCSEACQKLSHCALVPTVIRCHVKNISCLL